MGNPSKLARQVGIQVPVCQLVVDLLIRVRRQPLSFIQVEANDSGRGQ